MTSRASVGGDERLRLFLGLRLPDAVLDALESWQGEHLRSVRVVPRGHLHITLAFLGSRPAAELDGILGELRSAAAHAPADLRLAPSRYRETRSVAMLVLDDLAGGVSALAEDVQARLERLGVYRREARPWLPHVTVARFRERPRLRLDPPPVGTFVPSDAAAYLSRLHPSAGSAGGEAVDAQLEDRGRLLQPRGARYVVLESVALGG